MKRIGLILLAAVILAGCSSKDDKEYDFNGTWSFQQQVVSAVCTWEYASGRVVIVQDGTSLTWNFVDYAYGGAREGNCDPDNASLYVRYTNASGTTSIIRGIGDDENTISGKMSGTNGDCSYSSNFTLELISR